ncbi:MAG: DUF4330 family protein [Oscillospiraceae bacterium]|jgi:hypothetical protein|nr:DUF4330 family protein [Oscillospiraceae bacterium]
MEKKRFRLNVVDIIVIIVILAAVGFFAYRVKTADKPVPIIGVTQRIDYEVVVDLARTQIADYYAGLEYPVQMVSSGKAFDGYVDEVITDYHDAERVELTFGGAVIRLNEGVKWFCRIKFKCHAFVDSADLTNTVLTQEIRVGNNYIVKTANAELLGQIISIKRGDA